MMILFDIFETLAGIGSDFCYMNGSTSSYCLEFFSTSVLGNYPKDNLATMQNRGCSSDVYLKYTQKKLTFLRSLAMVAHWTIQEPRRKS